MTSPSTNSVSSPLLTGKTVLITGGNAARDQKDLRYAGIGLWTAIGLAKLGARVIITARSRPGTTSPGEAAVAAIQRLSGNAAVECVELDLADFESIERCAARVLEICPRLDVLVLNAGAVLERRTTTKQGFESTFGVNHLGHFLLTRLLLDRLRASAPARIVVVASNAHRAVPKGMNWDDLMGERRYRAWTAYAQSKLANLLFMRELAKRLSGTGVSVNALHPGVVATGFGGDEDVRNPLGRLAMRIARKFMIDSEQGADTAVWLASDPGLEGRSGGYWDRRAPGHLRAWASDDAAAARLWQVSEALLASVGR